MKRTFFLFAENFCTGRTDGLYPKINDCTKFIYCKNGRDNILQCKTGQTFHPMHKSCTVDRSPLCSRTTVATFKTTPSGKCKLYEKLKHSPFMPHICLMEKKFISRTGQKSYPTPCKIC